MQRERPILRDIDAPHAFEVFYEGIGGHRYRIEVTVMATGLRAVEWIVATHEPRAGNIAGADLERIWKTIGAMIADLEAKP